MTRSWTPRDTPAVLDSPIAALRADLERADFTVDGVEAVIGPVASAALHREQDLPADRATDGAHDPLSVLVRLFVLGRPVLGTDLATALPSLGVYDAVRLAVVCPVGQGLVRAMCDLRPYGEDDRAYWLASDLSQLATGGALRADHVLGVGGASETLAQWTIRRQVGRALDLGTGCGVQAVHLAGHADSVVATDVSRRALGFAAFNFALNGIDAVCLEGDFLDRVRGCEFDLVVSNPPFVITPRTPEVTVYDYRDSGRRGDELVRELVAQVGDILAPGGVAQLLGNWEVARGSTWRKTWGRWLEGVSCDAWVVQREVQDPAEYAELWLRDAGTAPGTGHYDQMYAAWLNDFESRDIDRVGFGVVTLHRPAPPRAPWRDLEDLRTPVGPGLGAVVDAGLTARNWLADNGIEAVLDQAWTVAPDVIEQRHFQPGDEDPLLIQASRGGALPRTLTLDTVSAALLGVCQGQLTARAALAAIGSLLDLTTPEAIRRATPAMRRLVADGYLTRASEH